MRSVPLIPHPIACATDYDILQHPRRLLPLLVSRSLRTPARMLIASDLFMISICVSLCGYLSSTLHSSQAIILPSYPSPAYIIIAIYHSYSPYTPFYLVFLYFLFSLPLFVKFSPICILL
ncbi:uncharacterized protein BT62DRAFT_370637 [Guyanagaster necrorhizus]|uniref:Uncharacterized protein n=1 Tax=Guyanagaster necrorhizus TaxID=856835 RepID=A0A9P7VLA3_9AGAR|nr:uncharacterized protein BT62DRAFT_370637 [Guyanagaster necrorhizus MCA 3950]KAG7442712.1 hypothetical protein BT62DRAFT_370637 [Guyanagaster necrorhizus MCA 3950]